MAENFDFSVVDRILEKYPKVGSSSISILQDIQAHYHYLPREIFEHVARAIGVGEARLYGVATFYENFSLEPKGKYVIRCCDGTACHVRGSNPILREIRKELGLSATKVTTDDLNFTVETVSCLGACSLSPVITINGEVHPGMTPDKALKLVREIEKKISQEGAAHE